MMKSKDLDDVRRSKIAILYVDVEPFNLIAFLAHFRTNKNYEIYTCRSGEEGIIILYTIPIDIIISDQRMPNMTGIEFIEESFKINIESKRIIVTAHYDNKILDEALKEGKIINYHQKPWNWGDIERSIEDAYKGLLQERETIR